MTQTASFIHLLHISIVSLKRNTLFLLSTPSTPSGMRYDGFVIVEFAGQVLSTLSGGTVGSWEVSVTRTRPATLIDSMRAGAVF